jgi:NTP pyrophosphatase (non-canonical NTP hydrolase)
MVKTDKQIVILPDGVGGPGGVYMNEYQREARLTDKMDKATLQTPVLGLFGEVGSLLSALKKKIRDESAFADYEETILEELGDALWYFTIIAARADLDLSILAQKMSRGMADWDEVEHHEFGTFGDIQSKVGNRVSTDEFARLLMLLAGRAGELAADFGVDGYTTNRDKLSAHLVDIFRALLAVADAAEVSLADAAYQNLRKTHSRWPTKPEYPDLVDSDMPPYEQLPREFEMLIEEVPKGKRTFVFQSCNGVTIGDRLTDNKMEDDDYRFHDVFHIAYAVHLGWSPVLRYLFHRKRKSDPKLDANEDGARAILIEEGVSSFVFSRALERSLFSSLDHVDYDLLKAIQEMIRGYEVERCALWQWEKAILDGFKVFRELKVHRKGLVDADLEAHTLGFRLPEIIDS